jgi:hypothetical protein
MEINNVTCAVFIGCAYRTVCGSHAPKQCGHEFASVNGGQPQNRSEHARFVFTSGMLMAQAVIREFTDIDNRSICVRDFHSISSWCDGSSISPQK